MMIASIAHFESPVKIDQSAVARGSDEICPRDVLLILSGHTLFIGSTVLSRR